MKKETGRLSKTARSIRFLDCQPETQRPQIVKQPVFSDDIEQYKYHFQQQNESITPKLKYYYGPYDHKERNLTPNDRVQAKSLAFNDYFMDFGDEDRAKMKWQNIAGAVLHHKTPYLNYLKDKILKVKYKKSEENIKTASLQEMRKNRPGRRKTLCRKSIFTGLPQSMRTIVQAHHNLESRGSSFARKHRNGAAEKALTPLNIQINSKASSKRSISPNHLIGTSQVEPLSTSQNLTQDIVRHPLTADKDHRNGEERSRNLMIKSQISMFNNSESQTLGSKENQPQQKEPSKQNRSVSPLVMRYRPQLQKKINIFEKMSNLNQRNRCKVDIGQSSLNTISKAPVNSDAQEKQSYQNKKYIMNLNPLQLREKTIKIYQHTLQEAKQLTSRHSNNKKNEVSSPARNKHPNPLHMQQLYLKQCPTSLRSINAVTRSYSPFTKSSQLPNASAQNT